MSHSPSKNIVIAGASGYVGRALIIKLREKFPDAQITALSRLPRTSADPQVLWKSCDLFSLRELEEVLPEKVDVAYFLVHSMLPTSQLDQGDFRDYDLIISDNFARTLQKRNVDRVIYLGGIIPPNCELSRHLESRLEVEEVFKFSLLPLTIFRAGIIVGPHGSSFQMVIALLKRLPLMICPEWTQTLMTPTDIETVVGGLVETLDHSHHIGEQFDFAGCPPITYLELLKETAKWLGLRRIFIPVPLFSVRVSRLWVRFVTGKPKELVYPLIESLHHPMTARDDKVFHPPAYSSYSEMLTHLVSIKEDRAPVKFFRPKRRIVRSVQRLPLPKNFTAELAREEYVKWLPRFFRRIIHVWTESQTLVHFCFFAKTKDLLTLKVSRERSTQDRQLLYIVGGLLSGDSPRGRLEFREALHGRFLLVAIHEFRPALPWYIYTWTQALVHLFVMNAFGRHLRELENEKNAM